MTKVFLAAGVAALAISVPASAGPHGGGGQHAKADQRTERQQARKQNVQRQEARAQRVDRQQARPQRAERTQVRADRQQARSEQRQVRRADREQVRVDRVQQAQDRRVDRQQQRVHRVEQVQNRQIQRAQQRADRIQQVENRQLQRQQMRVDRMNNRLEGKMANGYGVGGCPPGLRDKGCVPPGIARKAQVDALRAANPLAFQRSRLQLMTPRTRILAPTQAAQYLGAPLSTVSNYVPLAALPQAVSYLYPDTPDYYYRYGDGYLYQVDRGTNLIASLLPLLAGGYMPGTYLPSSYMNSYVPDYYGLNSFYPATYGAGYGYGYDNLCNRYAYGTVYQVDCVTGLVQNVVPMYAGGYGVGQMIPSAYSYYNVPTQYRSMYYPTNDYSYWYAPGAIYQYDTSSSLITSVAALMSPGFSIGQPLPAGYNMYNVPMAYRSTYYDTPNAWYRYNNGYIYQVDPTTQLVTAIVASLLT